MSAKGIIRRRISQIIIWSKSYILPGFDNVPIYYIIRFIIQELKRDNLTTRANSVAFSVFLSIFPFLIFVLPILYSTPWAEMYIDSLRINLRGILPENAYIYLFDIIDSVKAMGKFSIRSLGFLSAMFFASSGMLDLIYSFDKSHTGSFKYRNLIQLRLHAIFLTIVMFFVWVATVLLIVLGDKIIVLIDNFLHWGMVALWLLSVLKYSITVFLFYTGITIIYRYGPSMHRPLKLVNAGVMTATFFCLLLSFGFKFFIDNFGKYNELYGSIGALVVLLIWLQINAFIVLAGFEINASIAVNRDLLQDGQLI